MAQLNPHDVRQSPVGPVFDVATWSPRKAVSAGVLGVVLGLVLAGLAVYAWDPHWIVDPAPQWLEGLNSQVAHLKDSRPSETRGAIALAGLVAVVFLLGGVSCLLGPTDRGYYFRVGPGGISLRLPRNPVWNRIGLGSKVLCLDVRWEDIASCNVVQIRPLGSQQAKTANENVYLRLKTTAGRRYRISFAAFREHAQIIAVWFEEARQMTLAQLGDATSAIRKTGLRRSEEKLREISSSLSKILWKPGSDAAVVLTDANTGKSVRISGGGGSLVLSLAGQSLDGEEERRAADLFGRQLAQTSPTRGAAVTAVAGEKALEVRVGSDVQRATELALNVFSGVYWLPDDFPLVVHER